MRIGKIIIFIGVIFLFVNISIASNFSADQPVLLTSAGQSADVLMVKVLAQKADLKFTFDKLAKPAALKNHASLIIVSGGSTKGLGAAKIDKDQELKRVQDLIHAAKKAKIKIIGMHVGGKARRGKLSNQFNALVAENADCVVVVQTGDKDQFFTNIAAKKKYPIYHVEKIIKAGDVLKEIYKVAEE